MRSPNSARLILVGERGNFSNLSGRKISWSMLLKIGAFTRGPSRNRLSSLGLSWQASINLLSPLPSKEASFDDHDRQEMKDNAWMTLLHARVTKSRVVLCGSHVCESFGVPFTPLSLHKRENVILYVLPHPSGRNRWWNTNSEAAREFVQSIMKETYETSDQDSLAVPDLL